MHHNLSPPTITSPTQPISLFPSTSYPLHHNPFLPHPTTTPLFVSPSPSFSLSFPLLPPTTPYAPPPSQPPLTAFSSSYPLLLFSSLSLSPSPFPINSFNFLHPLIPTLALTHTLPASAPGTQVKVSWGNLAQHLLPESHFKVIYGGGEEGGMNGGREGRREGRKEGRRQGGKSWMGVRKKNSGK